MTQEVAVIYHLTTNIDATVEQLAQWIGAPEPSIRRTIHNLRRTGHNVKGDRIPYRVGRHYAYWLDETTASAAQVQQ